LLVENLKKREYFDSCEDKSEYYTILFDCLRFDRKNLDISVKAELSVAFLGFISQKEPEENPKSENLLRSVRKVFKFLLFYCLKSSSPAWRNYYRFELMVQAIMTETDILSELAVLE
jgi:hypothetical protein